MVFQVDLTSLWNTRWFRFKTVEFTGTWIILLLSSFVLWVITFFFFMNNTTNTHCCSEQSPLQLTVVVVAAINTKYAQYDDRYWIRLRFIITIIFIIDPASTLNTLTRLNTPHDDKSAMSIRALHKALSFPRVQSYLDSIILPCRW